MNCYLTRTSSFLPGPRIANDEIETYLGTLEGEAVARQSVLAMNGITGRHYAQNHHQQATHDVYELAAEAVSRCLPSEIAEQVTYLSGGTTFAPLAAPGFASILHDRLSQKNVLSQPVEISSHSGICTSASNALVAAIRAVDAGAHKVAVCTGAEHASQILKSSVIQPIDDRDEHVHLRNSKWFMSVFLRFMLSDGAGAVLLQDQPATDGMSLQVNWTHSMSFANQAPLCMKLESQTALLSQDVSILSKYLVPCGDQFLDSALTTHNDTLDSHRIILPHMSSFFFRRKMERVISVRCANPEQPVPYWTNLSTAGNTGAASIYVMLDEYLRDHSLAYGEKILLFIPESGQFNYVLISLTAVLP